MMQPKRAARIVLMLFDKGEVLHVLIACIPSSKLLNTWWEMQAYFSTLSVGIMHLGLEIWECLEDVRFEVFAVLPTGSQETEG